MRCPNKKCRREVDRILIVVTPAGKVIEGCHTCVPQRQDRKLYTGKKIWTGQDVDGVERNREKIHQFGEKLKQRAERNRRTWSPLREAQD